MDFPLISALQFLLWSHFLP